MRYFDIAINLTDPMFKGIYRGKQCHPNDMDQILKRAKDCGVVQMLITGTGLDSSKEALDLAIQHDFLSTAGCHPTQTQEWQDFPKGPQSYYDELKELIFIDKQKTNRIRAIGECGLDYDRLQFSPKDLQLQYFRKHFDLAKEFKLPMFFHDRNSGDDFANIVREHRDNFQYGVVHSFTGTMEQMHCYTNELDLFIGINGCSLKTIDNLVVVKEIPLNKIMVETDAPWCDIRPTHASFKYLTRELPFDLKKKEKFTLGSMVKGRNEPCSVQMVVEIIAAVKGIDVKTVAEAVLENSLRVFSN